MGFVGSVIDLFAAYRSNMATGTFDAHSQSLGLQGATALVMTLLRMMLTAGAGGQPAGAKAATLTSQVVKSPDQKSCNGNKESYEAEFDLI